MDGQRLVRQMPLWTDQLNRLSNAKNQLQVVQFWVTLNIPMKQTGSGWWDSHFSDYRLIPDRYRIKREWESIGEDARMLVHTKERYKANVARRLMKSDTEKSKGTGRGTGILLNSEVVFGLLLALLELAELMKSEFVRRVFQFFTVLPPFLALLDYVSRAHGIEIRPSSVRRRKFRKSLKGLKSDLREE